MKALLLAAGVGSRLRPITEHIPKCMVSINGRPLLSYWIDLLLIANIEQILINTHYLSHVVVDYINSLGLGNRVKLIYEKELLGTAGTVLAAEPFLENQSFMVIHADNLSKVNLQSFEIAHRDRPKDTAISMLTFTTDNPSSCGIIEQDEQGRVIGFHEKINNPPGNCANGAIYIFEPEIVNFIASLDTPIKDISTQVLPNFIGRIFCYHNDEYHRDIGTPESLRLARKEFIAQK